MCAVGSWISHGNARQGRPPTNYRDDPIAYGSSMREAPNSLTIGWPARGSSHGEEISRARATRSEPDRHAAAEPPELHHRDRQVDFALRQLLLNRPEQSRIRTHSITAPEGPHHAATDVECGVRALHLEQTRLWVDVRSDDADAGRQIGRASCRERV